MLRYIIVAFLACFSFFINSARAQEVANTFRYPVTSDGLGSSYVYSQGYRDPDNRTHDGADFAYNCGEPIYAVANGQVEESAYRVSYDGNGNVIPNTGWGNLIRIKHTLPNGDERYSQYAHLQDRYLSNGETVTYGQQIGIVGTTGYSTGCHLHFMIITVGSTRGCGYFPSASGCLGDWTEERYWSTFIDPIDFLDEHLGSSIPTDAYDAITAKADELWGIVPSGSTLMCGNRRSGLICEEPTGGNMHWYGGMTALTDSFIIEDWGISLIHFTPKPPYANLQVQLNHS